MLRLFVAIDLPDSIKAQLAGLRTRTLPARWVEPERLHLTLRFVGNVDDGIAQTIDSTLRHVSGSRFSLALKGVGHFRRRTLWVGIEDCPLLMSLQAQVEDAIQAAGLAPQGGRYVPHVKLARLGRCTRRELRAFLNDHAHFCAAAFEVERFTLMESILSKEGSTYRHREDYTLALMRLALAEGGTGS